MTRLFGCLCVFCLLLALSAFVAYAAEYDVNQDGTGDFTTIQAAIDAANDADVIVVHPGTYYENVHFDGKNITLRSTAPEDEEVVAATVIDGRQNGSVVTFAGTEDETCLLSGFTITNGNSSGEGGGVLGGDPWCDPRVCTFAAISNCTVSKNRAEHGGGLGACDGTISNCKISGNTAVWDGGGLSECCATVSNCAITANWASLYGGGLYDCWGRISNCTICDNSASAGGGLYDWDHGIDNCILWANDAFMGDNLWGGGEGLFTYCCVGGWTAGGEGNISNDPLFVSGPLGDYYLSCKAAGQAADSPCIDVGSATAESLGLAGLTTRTDQIPDTGIVDMGYHYYPTTTGEGPVIECSLNSNNFSPGDQLFALYQIENPGPDVMVDIYFAFVFPDGAILCISPARIDFGIFPCMTDVLLQQGYSTGATSLLSIGVPGGLPVGSYLFAGALCLPGQFVFIGAPSLFPFIITD
ncbi:MAG: right-handed parallel beta-helix repeat-containing protein [Candidatus Coatesbacteria bacterium]|nr:right-handed parallel beta-helix repeat-containing protein [Candidatus Coatesbacteria bacterium]